MQGFEQKRTPISMRNYGRIIQDMIHYTCTVTAPDKRNTLIVYIAQCMRQKNIIWNKEQDSGLDRIINDITVLSKGRLSCDFAGFQERFNLIRQHRPIIPNFPKKKK